jgi:hypothetical protein
VSRRALASAAGFAVALAVLAAVAVAGDETDRRGATVSLVAIALGLYVAVRQQRTEHEPDDMPSDAALLVELLDGRGMAAFALLAYVIAFVALDAAGVLAAGVASVALVANGYLGARAALRRHGLERDQFVMATSTAFLFTTGACGVWTMFEIFADAPRLSMGVPWTIGVVTWLGTSAVLHRRAA